MCVCVCELNTEDLLRPYNYRPSLIYDMSGLHIKVP